MGRGDIKTKKGKIFAGSFGKTRPAKAAAKAVAVVEVAEKKKTAKKKAQLKNEELGIDNQELSYTNNLSQIANY